MEFSTIPVGLWNRFLTHNLNIDPQLVGAEHEFKYEGYSVLISLPSIENLPTEPSGEKRLRFNSYTEADGKKTPLQLWVESIDIAVTGTDKIKVPPELLSRPPNQRELLTEAKQNKLTALAANLNIIAEKAFDLWLRILRWKSTNSAIGRPEINGHSSGWPACLVAQPNGERIWIPTVTFAVKGSKIITSQIWEAAASALQTGNPSPLHVDFLMDATEHVKLGAFQRAIVETAMGCEVFLRNLVAENLPPDLQPAVSRYVDEANIRPVMDKFVPDILSSKERDILKKIRSKLQQLFDMRNAIVHKGKAVSLTKELCEKFLDAATLLVAIRE